MRLPNTAGGRGVLAAQGIYTNQAPVFTKRGVIGIAANFCAGMVNAVALTTGAPAAGTLRALPFQVAEDCTADQLALEVTAAVATAVSRVGIYDSTADIYPGALIGESGQMATDTVGVVTAAVSLALKRGVLYWAALLGGTAAANIRCLNMGNAASVLGVGAAFGTTYQVGWFHAQAYGTLPSAFPSSGPGALSALPVPCLFVRIA